MTNYTLPIVLGNLSAGNQPLSDFDTDFDSAARMGALACTASGTNAVALTKLANYPTMTAYGNYQKVGFVASATSTSVVSISVSALASLNAYMQDGTTRVGSDALNGHFVGFYYEYIYNSALNSSAGGWQRSSATTSAPGLIYLTTANASNAASVVFGSTYITSAYNKYVIEFDSMAPVTDVQQMALQISTDNGGSWISTGYQWSAIYDSALGAFSPTINADGSNVSIGILFGGGSSSVTTANQSLGAVSNDANQGHIEFSVPSNASNHFAVTYYGSYWGISANNFFVNTRGGGTYSGGLGVINAIRFIMTAGNMSGNFHLYGLMGT